MVEAEWLTSTDPQAMFRHLSLGPQCSDIARKWVLLACGCCRTVERYLREEPWRSTVEVVESWVDGFATLDDLGKKREEVYRARGPLRDLLSQPLTEQHLAEGVVDILVTQYNRVAAESALARLARVAELEGRAAEGQALLAALVRCVFGNPFRTVTVNPDWLTWNGGTVPKIARTIYHDRCFDRMPVLANALEEA